MAAVSILNNHLKHRYLPDKLYNLWTIQNAKHSKIENQLPIICFQLTLSFLLWRLICNLPLLATSNIRLFIGLWESWETSLDFPIFASKSVEMRDALFAMKDSGTPCKLSNFAPNPPSWWGGGNFSLLLVPLTRNISLYKWKRKHVEGQFCYKLSSCHIVKFKVLDASCPT